MREIIKSLQRSPEVCDHAETSNKRKPTYFHNCNELLKSRS
uniref:Uncharacterized protein n=1 Tax=Anguilla anguilla TaxID=7936 RepID=A0A0E9PK64_ANGAN